MKTQDLIHEFLSQKRFAVVGVSRNPKDFSRTLFDEFMRRGYEVVPVNPHATHIEGRRCFSSVAAVTPPVTSALVMTPGNSTPEVVTDCLDAGVTLVWLYGIRGVKDVEPEAVELCEKHGAAAIAGYCPFMFLGETAWYHRLHGWAWKMIGYYPQS